jgi:hypothetical protein
VAKAEQHLQKLQIQIDVLKLFDQDARTSDPSPSGLRRPITADLPDNLMRLL